MAGKYANVVGNLPRFDGNEQTHQDHINQRKAELRATADFRETTVALATNYVALRLQQNELEAKMENIQLSLEAITQMLETQYEADGTTSIRLVDGFSVTLQIEPYALVKDRDAYRKWAIAEGLERLMALPWQTTNSITKERLLTGKPEPDGVEVYAKTKLVLRKV
ncbi:MAG: hypothetical protein ABFD60_01485 [Bryobacteraceae bacterium]